VSCFETAKGRFCLGDVRKLIKEVPDSSIDAIITDPPWGVGFDEYDNFDVFIEVAEDMHRVLKPNAWLVFFFTPKRIYDLTPLLRYFEYKWMIPYVLWSYSSMSRNPLGSPASYSIIMVFAKGRPKVKVPRKDVIISDELPIVTENVREPQFKPTYVVATLLTMFTSENELILDPFAGYGSIPLVCELYNRRWLAFEMDPVKYEVAKRIVTEKKVGNIRKMKSSITKTTNISGY